MRPGQNKRMRGRNNNNGGGGHRRGPNPLTRSYESNGPDVKIRGTAQHIGEKYLQLARDAQTSGDPVAAENYLQHAEHYFRIIAAAQQAQQQAQFGYQRAPGEVDAEDGDSDDDVVMPDRFALPSERFPQSNGTGQQPPYPAQGGYERQDRNPQPTGEQPYRAERQPGAEQRDPREQRPEPYRQPNDYRQNGGERQNWDRQGERQGGDRQGGERQNWDRQNGERGGYDRPRNDRNQQQRGPRQPRDGQDQREPRNERDYQPREYRDARDPSVTEGRARVEAPPAAETEVGAELPAFITAPVRPAAPSSAPADIEASPNTTSSEVPSMSAESSTPEPELFPVKTRRRRRPRAALESDAAIEPAPEPVDPGAE